MKRTLFFMVAIISLAGMIAICGCKKKETYIVTFNANGGTGTMQQQTFTEDEEQALSRNTFTYDGYTFTVWNTVQDGSGASYTDGQTITVPSDVTLYAQWTGNGLPTPSEPQPTTGELNGHDWVDLGVPSGTKWATCNVGSDTPEGNGGYFAWGETVTKENYDWSTYRWCNGSENTLTKYCASSAYGYNGFTDNLATLEATDDAATANWGAGWRMPTSEEVVELIHNCTHTWTSQNGVNGCLFTGVNGNSVFMPAAGGFSDNSCGNIGTDGYYWTSSLSSGENEYVYGLYFHSYAAAMGNFSRYLGHSVRPVCR